jgi:hypothetical protein
VQIEYGRKFVQDIFISADGKRRILKIICHDEPVIYLPETAHKTKAAMIKGHEENALRLFRKIAMWVFNTIEDKNFSTSLASALETLERKQGDCTEHAVLTAALARAAGIPTRIAAGLYYAQERFSYHMWVEALVAENLWVAVDPAMGQIEPDALHLKLFHGDLDYNTHTNMTWTLIQSLKPDDLKIVELNKTF